MIRIHFYLASILLFFLISENLQAQDDVAWGQECLGGQARCIPSHNNDRAIFHKTGENELQLKVLIEFLTLEEQQIIAGKPFDELDRVSELVFIQELDLLLDYELIEKHGLNPEYNTLKSGEYPLEITEEEVIITLTLNREH